MRKIWMCALALLLSVSALTGCGRPGDESGVDVDAFRLSDPSDPSSPRYGGHLRVGYTIGPTSLDAVLGRSGGDTYYWRQIFDNLVDVDPQLRSRPSTSLATSWEIATDPHSITFHLREGVTFHDGTPFNAEAVKFNIERILDPKTMATPRASFTVIDSVDALDELTVRFNLKRPWGAGLNMLADRGGIMSSPAAIEAFGKEYGWNPSGTGPFILDKFITGTLVHLVRNPNYWGTDEKGNQLPYLDEVTIHVILDETVRASALRTGEIDLAYLPNKDVSAFERDERFQIEVMQGGGIAVVLAFNIDKPPLDDVNLRRAVSYAINSEVINKAIFFDRAIVADSGMWPTGAWAHDPDVERPYYDIEKAREFLRAGGKPDGFEFTAVAWNSPTLVPTTEILRAMLKKIGVTMNIEIFHTGPATEAFFHAREYPLYVTSWSRYPEPDWLASLAYKTDGYYNAGNLERPDVDRLVEQGAALYETADRKVVYDELNALVLDEAWYVPLLYAVNYAAAPLKVHNLDKLMSSDGKMDLRRIWLSE
ncbi:MAG: ABC transporter substrate-binding protein [Candidatus Hydrogenedentes bacterium]|nr:ABC transporter substrate-binding protein [Candidatus Hydrogenedentota bacterium]